MKKNGRLTFGYITNYFGNDLINYKIWQGLNQAAETHNINFICVPANPWNTPVGFTKMGNALYKMVTKENFDGLILWGGGLTGHATPEDVNSIYNTFKDFPIVNISVPRPGIPTISIDNYPGMYSLCKHMIKVHKSRRIAFIRGPKVHKEAEARYKAYCDCLRDNDIAIDDTLVAVGDFLKPSGRKCVRELLDKRKCSFDALISASDLMTFGAINELEERGISIPEDIKIGSFDDLEESVIQNAPLTTVRQPFTRIGYLALEMLADIIAGKKVDEHTFLKSELIVRQSCGCPDPLNFPANVFESILSDKETNLQTERTHKEKLNAKNIRCPEQSQVLEDLGFDRTAIHKSFLKNLTGDTSVDYTAVLAGELMKLQESSNIQAVMDFLAALKQAVLEYTEGNQKLQQKLLLLVQISKTAINDKYVKLSNLRALETEVHHTLLEEISHNFIAAFDINNLFKIIADIFSRFGIKQYYLALYKNADKNLKKSHLVIANKTLQGEPEKDLVFDSVSIIPDKYCPLNERYSLILEPLYFEDKHLGYLVFGREFLKGTIYTSLQLQLSVALQASLLIKEKENLLDKIEKRAIQLQEATAKLQDSNQELQLFAYSASHDLREPLRKIRIFSEQLHMDYASVLDEQGLDILTRMESAVSRMQALLRNLLAYSRITTSNKPFVLADLNDIVADAVSDLEVLISQHNAIINIPKLPNVNVDPVQIRQLFQNLIDNAIKFQKKKSIPVIDISWEKVSHHKKNYCEIHIKDNGIGIQTEYLEKIFGIFQRLHSQTEYKGTGIGLAICRRVVERHKGRLTVKSTPGKGADFIISLPVENE